MTEFKDDYLKLPVDAYLKLQKENDSLKAQLDAYRNLLIEQDITTEYVDAAIDKTKDNGDA